MGVLSGRDLLTAKHVTAEITDSEDRIHYVPIKHTIGDYFLVDLEGKLFAFSLKGARILIHKKTMTKSFRVIQYDTCNFRSLQPMIKEMEVLMVKEGLPKMNRMLYDVLRILGRREKAKDFEGHDIKKLVDEFSKKEGDYPETVRNIKEYLNQLDINTIVTPVRRITDFITEDLIATSPSFLAELLPRYQRLDAEHRKITNTPVKGTGGILKLAVIFLMAIVIIVGVVYANDQGVFKGATDMFDSFSTLGDGLGGLPSPTQGFQKANTGGNDYSDASIQAKYSGCDTLKPAIDSGEINYNLLSSNMKGLVDSCP